LDQPTGDERVPAVDPGGVTKVANIRSLVAAAAEVPVAEATAQAARAKVIADGFADAAEIAGRYVDGEGEFVEVDADPAGNVMRGVTPRGRYHFSSLAVGPANNESADVPRFEFADGKMAFRGKGFMPSANGTVSLMDLSATEWADAAELVIDEAGFVISAVMRDGRVLSTAGLTPKTGNKARLIDTAMLPDGALAPNPSGGWTGTGLDRVPVGHRYAGCWLVANHGQDRAYSPENPKASVYQSSVLLLTPDRRRIIWERPMPAGAQSVQGVARGMEANTYWAVDKRPSAPALSSIRKFDFSGVEDAAARILITDLMPAPDFNLNGIALHPGVGSAGGLWVGCNGIQRIYLVDIATKAILRTFTTFAAAGDQIGYDAKRDWLYFSYGPNGTDGVVRFLNGTTGNILGDVVLPGSQSIEGIKLIEPETPFFTKPGHFQMLSVNDGGYHTEAKPPLSQTNLNEVFLEF
jgi:hypothetical protein